MKKIISLVSLILCTLAILTIYFIKQDNNKYIAVYLDNIEGTSIPDRNSNYIIDKIICDNDAVGTWDNANWGLLVTNMSKRSNCKTYFRSKKDITITYDNNYIKNNIFEEFYNINDIRKNGFESDTTKFTLKSENNSICYTFNSIGDEISDEYTSAGYYIYPHSRLSVGKKYTFQFEAIGNENYEVTIGPEQQELLTRTFTITGKHAKYTSTFTAISNNHIAFSFYGWIAKNKERALEVKNIALQEGEYDNYSTTILKEYDNLNNTLPTPTRENYTFLGWYTDPIEGEKISSETIVTEDTTYYAHWQYNESL